MTERSFELQNHSAIVLMLFTFHTLPPISSILCLLKDVKAVPGSQPKSASILLNYPANETFLRVKREHIVLFKDHALFGDNTICNIPFTPT